MMEVWQFISGKLAQEIPVMLLYVLQSNGSSPGRQGFKMAVSGDGQLCGSIGGGIMEHKFVELAKARLADSQEWEPVQKQVHDKAAGNHQSGMICSGDQTIFIYRVQQSDWETVDRIINVLKNHRNASLILGPGSISFSEKIPSRDYFFEQYSDTDFKLVEKLGLKNALHIVGGGHCALALSQLAAQLDFYITLYETRSGLNTMAINQWAHEKIMLEDYADLTNKITGGESVYVVIMSFGYRTDSIAVKALWGKPFKYIGLLGSRKKIEKLFSDFADEGLDAAYANTIHSPIGLPIHSKSPAEIAISIAAEIIAEKNKF
jgi:xanthine dehydrogenase accessory factor